MSFLDGILDSVGLGAILVTLAISYYVLSTAYSWYRLRHVPVGVLCDAILVAYSGPDFAADCDGIAVGG